MRSIVTRWATVAAIAIAGPLTAATARAQTTAVYLDSQVGDSIGAGLQRLYTASAVFPNPWIGISPGSAIQIRVSGSDLATDLVVDLYGGAEPLRQGAYYFAPTNRGDTRPNINVYGNGRACASRSGRFLVREIEYNAGRTFIVRLAVDFEQHCDDTVPALFGAIRINSTIASLTPFGGGYPSYGVTIEPPAHGKISGEGIDCGSDGTACTVALDKPQWITLQAVAAPGFDLLGWEGSCDGSNVALLHVVGPASCRAIFGPIAPDVPRTQLFISSVTGDPIGSGHENRFSPGNSTLTQETTVAYRTIKFRFLGSLDEWRVVFRAPGGQRVEPGEYTFTDVSATTAQADSIEPAVPYFNANQGGLCPATSGRFVILESTFASDGTLVSFAADFEQQCVLLNGLRRPPLFGAIRYHSTVPGVQPFGGGFPSYRLLIAPPQHGQIDGPDLACGQEVVPLRCSVSFTNPAMVTLQAVHYPGFGFVGWTRDCAGTGTPMTVSLTQGVTVCSARFSDVEPLRVLSLTADAQFPVRIGTPVTWTAVPSRTSGTEFMFWRRSPAGGGWTVARPYSPNPSFTWTPSAPDVGENAVRVWIREALHGATFEDERSVTFTVDAGPCPLTLSSSAFLRISDVARSGFAFGSVPDGCRVSLQSSAPWLTPSVGAGGVLSFAAQRNLRRVPRTGTIAVVNPNGEKVTIAVEQADARKGSLPVDFNGDGLGDALLYGPGTGNTRISVTRLDGTATSFTGIASPAWATGWTIRPAEFNGDGLTDLFLYNPTSGLFYKAVNIGGGQFSFFGYPWAAGWQPTVVDFNGDGLSDVFLYNPTTGRWFTCVTASGQSDFVYATGLWATNWDVFPADFDGDGRTDLFLYNRRSVGADPNGGLWFRVMTQVDGSFTYLPGDVRWAAGWQISATDFDGDDRTDLFLYSPVTGQWFTVQFSASSAVYRTGLWANYWTITAGDFDGDRRSDLFLYDPITGRWFVAVTIEPGTFGYATGLWAPGWTVSASDFNGDGVPDLLLYNPSNGTNFQAVTATPGLFSYTADTWPAGGLVMPPQRPF